MLRSTRSPDLHLTPNVDPRLPPEIEREIFVLAFHANTEDQCMLLLIANRITEWLVPFLYNAITIESKSSRNIKFPPISSFRIYGHHVRHLFLVSCNQSWPDPKGDLLRLCPNISNLGFWFNTKLVPEVLDLRLERLILYDFNFLTDLLDQDPNEAKFASWRSRITHLGLGKLIHQRDRRYLAYFPAVRYLMFLHGGALDDSAVAGVWEHTPQLKVFIRVLGNVTDKDITKVASGSGYRNSDIRVVTLDSLVVDDWRRGSAGRPDMWEIAKREVEMRQRESRWRLELK